MIINGNIETIILSGSGGGRFWRTRCIYFPEGITEIDFGSLFHPNAETPDIILYLPSTLQKVSGRNQCVSEEAIVHCKSLEPEVILDYYNTYHSNMFKAGTIYVPRGTKEKYEQSIFNRMNIIEEVMVEGVSIADNKDLYVGDRIRMTAQILPSDASEQTVNWKSSNEEIVTISEDGEMEAISYGTATITVITKDGGFTAQCLVNVFEHTTGIEIIDNITIPIGKEYKLDAKTLPLLTSDGKINYESDNSSIASVNEEGVVIGNNSGTCNITATSIDGNYLATCEVVVKDLSHSYKLKVSDAGMASMYLDYPVVIPDNDNMLGVFYVCSMNNHILNLKRLKETIPANCGVIVMANPGTFTFKETLMSTDVVEENLLTGTTIKVNTADISGDVYTLGRGVNSGYMGFHKYTGATLPANKAYLVRNADEEEDDVLVIDRSTFDELFESTTDVTKIVIEDESQPVVYDIQGRRVEHPSKGIYIVNGKKKYVK